MNMLREWYPPSTVSFLVEVVPETFNDDDDVVLWSGPFDILKESRETNRKTLESVVSFVEERFAKLHKNLESA